MVSLVDKLRKSYISFDTGQAIRTADLSVKTCLKNIFDTNWLNTSKEILTARKGKNGDHGHTNSIKNIQT